MSHLCWPARYSLQILLLAFTVLSFETGSVIAAEDWWQWGGPQRNFVIKSTPLADSWPPAGPRRLWVRDLGDGYSGMAVKSGRLYTMMHRRGQEVIVALDANNGKTIWEYAYDVVFLEKMKMDPGPGPHSTPLVVGSRVFTTGTTGRLHCLESKNGRVIWSRDLYGEFGGDVLVRGYSSSPLAYRQMVIVPVGGQGHGIMAFNQRDGSVVWQKQDFSNSHSSPTLINVDGQDQIVVLMHKVIAGISPKNGSLIWSVAHEMLGDQSVFTPLWTQDNLLFYSVAYKGGSRLLRLSRQKGKTEAQELWFNNKMRIHHGNAVRVGGQIYGSSGDFGPAFMTAIDVQSGNILWQDRSYPKAMLLYADGKFIVLDEDGNLSLARMDRQGLKIISKVELLKNNAWTAPSLLGTTLYVRDRKRIMALDLR